MSSPNGSNSPGGVPPWLAALGIKNGGYFVDSKHRTRRVIESKIFSPGARIHSLLSLATMAFHQELAVKLKGGKRVPLTPADVCAATGIRREHFRRHMAELDAQGLAKCVGSTKGHVLIYAWAVPRDVQKEKIVTAVGDKFKIVCEDGGPVSESLMPTLRHFRIRVGSGEVMMPRGDLVELDRLARVTKDAELSLRAYADSYRARLPHIRKKETERNLETNEQTDRLSTQIKACAAAPQPVRSIVLSPIQQQLKSLLTTRYDLPTPLEGKPLDELTEYITNEGVLARFKTQLAKQDPRPDSWMYFVPIARACAAAHAAREEERKLIESEAIASAEEQERRQKRECLIAEQINTEAARIEQEDNTEFETRAREKVKGFRSAGRYPHMSDNQILEVGRQTVRNEIRESLQILPVAPCRAGLNP